MAKGSKRFRGERDSAERFVERCTAGLEALDADGMQSAPEADPGEVHSASIRAMVEMLAVLVAAEQSPIDRLFAGAVGEAARAIQRGEIAAYSESLREVCRLTGMGIFALSEGLEPAVGGAAKALLGPHPDASFEPIFFQTMPLSWLGRAYQGMLAQSHRKGGGIYFTPPSLVTYIIENVLSPVADSTLGRLDSMPASERLLDVKVLDPAMGCGDFLRAAVDFLCAGAMGDRGENPEKLCAEVASNCVFGIDIDPVAVETARFCVWAACLFADGVADALNSHLICADALGPNDGRAFSWPDAFPVAFGERASAGFDAVVGNPPYVAAKNGLGRVKVRGQSDTYLLFLHAVMEQGLVRPGGMLSMVLPDPMLVRANASEIRCRLARDWTIVSLLHIFGAFPDAEVANVVPVLRNARATAPTFPASRIERAGDRRGFLLRPTRTTAELAQPVRSDVVLAQKRCELFYLLEGGSFGDIIRHIHGDDASLSTYQAPFVPLREMNIRAIFRGEEVGKAAINREVGDFPMLLGGQSVQPYEILWEGRRIDCSDVRKDLDRYLHTKILIQKSSAHLIAALDEVTRKRHGCVFPQSVYAVQLLPEGMGELYLLCILNSEVMNEYIWRTATGYKMLQPQIEIEDIRALPIRRVSFTTPVPERLDHVATGIGIFEAESLRASETTPFPGLGNFVAGCLNASPEMSDVVHDVLAHVGRLIVDLTAASRKSPETDTTHRLASARAACEAIVRRLYSSEQAQMALPW